MGKILNSPLSFFCVIYDGLSAEAVKPLCFSLALPSILLLSDPNPFHLLVLSNFNQSSRSLSWKRGIWPRFQKTVPFPVSRPQIDSSAAGARPKTMRGIFGTVIWRTHVIWTGHTLWRVTHSAGPKRSTFKRGGRGAPIHPSGHTLSSTHLCSSCQDRVSAPVLPRGPGPRASYSPEQGGGLRTHTHRSSSGNSRPSYRCQGSAIAWNVFFLHTPSSRFLSVTHAVWTDSVVGLSSQSWLPGLLRNLESYFFPSRSALPRLVNQFCNVSVTFKDLFIRASSEGFYL